VNDQIALRVKEQSEEIQKLKVITTELAVAVHMLCTPRRRHNLKWVLFGGVMGLVLVFIAGWLGAHS
jgi:hypothetical protein